MFNKLLTRVFAWKIDMQYGVQVYDAPDHTGQWMTTTATCPECGERFVVVVPVGQVGAECPYCGHVDLECVWSADT